MINHVVAFRFKPGIARTEVDSVLGEVATFPDQFPTMRNWSMGTNLSTRDNTFTHAFAVQFTSEDELLDYLHSDAHENFVRDTWRPVIEQQAIVSYVC